MKIKEIGKIIGGQVIGRVEAKNPNDEILGEVEILVPKSIGRGRIEHENLATIKYKAPLDERKITQVGDLVLKLSQPYDVAWISEEDEGLLATSFCLLLKNIDKRINPAYLAVLLNSSIYKEQAVQMTSGATVPLLTKSGVENIEIDVSLELQEAVLTTVKEIEEKEKLFSEIILLEKMKLENMLRGDCQ